MLKDHEELLQDLSPLQVDCSNTIMLNITSALQRSSEGEYHEIIMRWIPPMIKHLSRSNAEITRMCPSITQLRSVLERDIGLERPGVKEALGEVVAVLQRHYLHDPIHD